MSDPPTTFNDDLVHFILSGSMLTSMYPLIFLYQAYNQLTPIEKELSPISFQTLVLLYPIAFGILCAISYRVLFFIPRKFPLDASSWDAYYFRFIFSGALAGLLISLFLDKVWDIHTQWLKIENTSATHLLVFFFHLAIFYSVGAWCRVQVLYGPKPKSSSSSSYMNTKPSQPQGQTKFPPGIQTNN